MPQSRTSTRKVDTKNEKEEGKYRNQGRGFLPIEHKNLKDEPPPIPQQRKRQFNTPSDDKKTLHHPHTETSPPSNLQKRKRPSYEDDDYDSSYQHFYEEASDVEDATAQTIDTPDEQHRAYDEQMRDLYTSGFGRGLPFLIFSRKLEEAGYGEVLLPGPVFGDLDNDIHPIFQQESWIRERRFGEGRSNERDRLWCRMKPALRLATKFITEPKLMGWWVRALYSHQIRDKKLRRRYLSDPGDKGAEGLKRVAARLQYLVGRVRWSFCDIWASPGTQTHGMLSKSLGELDQNCGARSQPFPPHTEPLRALHIGINKAFRTYLLSDGYSEKNAPCKAMRANWFLAVSLTHELAHAFYASKAVEPSFQEPYFNRHDLCPELGYSWEQSLFGIVDIQAYVHRRYGILALQFVPYKKSEKQPWITVDTNIRYPLDPLWLYDFFQKTTWQRLQGMTGVEKETFLHPPEARVALVSAPLRKGERENFWIWVADEYPGDHRLSIEYWREKGPRAIEMVEERLKIYYAKERNLRGDLEYNPRARKRRKREKKVLIG